MIEFNQAVLEAVQNATQRLAEVGAKPVYVMIHNEVTVKAKFFRDYIAEKREEKANEFLEANTDSTVERRSMMASFAPDMIVRYEHNGVPVGIDFGSGICEKKQVGTTKRMGYDPEALKNIPMVEIEEPVYTYLCDDPLAKLV